MRLDWGSGQSIEVTTSQDLNAAFDAVSGGETGTEPVLAFLDGFKGTLTIGLGNLAGSVLMYRSRSTPPLVVHVVGDAPARVAQEDRPYLVFSASGRHYEFARRMGVTEPRAREVAAHFLESGGQLTGAVMWEEEGVPQSPASGAAPDR